MRAAILLAFLAVAAVLSNSACAADLPLRPRPALHRNAPLSPDQRIELFERFLQFLQGTNRSCPVWAV